MTNKEKREYIDLLRGFVAKTTEMISRISEIPTDEERTLFDEAEEPTWEEIADKFENPGPAGSAAPAAIVAPAPVKKRQVIKDGSMTASAIANHLSKKLHKQVSKDLVTKIAKDIGAEYTYSETQHASRYTPGAVATIMKIFKTMML